MILDSDWEAEFCRVAEAHRRVLAYVKNHNLGLEVPYRYGSEMRTYIPDFIVLVDDGHGKEDPLHRVVEIKGYRREDAKEKKNTMEAYWVPGVNNPGNYGRWAFAWSAAIDRLAADADGYGETPRLFVVSAGNVSDPNAWAEYSESNATDGIHDPGQSWNTLTVGAATGLVQITEPNTQAYQAIAPAGCLSPFSTTSLTWQP